MNDLPDLFHTDLVLQKWDIYWDNADEYLGQLSPRPVLILSRPFEPRSEEEKQLRKMLSACALKEDDFHLLQLGPDTCIAWHKMRTMLGVKSLLLLGVNTEQLGISAHLMSHQVSRFGGANWLVTLSLDQLIASADIKSHLWKYGLKPVFVDKVYG